jgi:WD40 repeat protein
MTIAGSRPGRRALSIGLDKFGADSVYSPYPLPFASDRVTKLRTALIQLGYSCVAMTGDDSPTSQVLGDKVREIVDDTPHSGVAVVHLLSHGELAPSGLYAIGADGHRHEGTKVEQWVERVADLPGKPYTLYLLDLCYAGKATRLAWQLGLPGENCRAWVIAATGSEEAAYSGVFSEAVVNVVDRISDGSIDIHPSYRHVPFGTVVEEIRREVNRLTVARDWIRQRVTATPIDGEYPDLPFFPNPRYVHDPRRRATAALDPGVLSFLDVSPVLDAAHFLDRAAARGPLDTLPETGFFTGRRHELSSLSSWIDNYESAHALRVVTGSPGVGKSALLGILVCAAQPTLRDVTYQIWRHLPERPSANADLVAVHARQHTLVEVLSSVCAQLGLLPTDGTSVDDVIAELASRERQPVIILDALDEAMDPIHLVRDLLLPLSNLRRPDGLPACRLFVGTRPQNRFAQLLNLARSSDGLIDLDQTPPEELRVELTRYVGDLLALTQTYGRTEYASARLAFATSVADVLASPQPSLSGDRWGEFLVAALYTYRLVISGRILRDPSEAAQLGREAPRTLPAVMELDLESRRGQSPWLRPVMVALAHAKGDGMPAEVIRRMAAAFAGGDADALTAADLDGALLEARFYIRAGADSDGSTLYRLFHQGLADYLRIRPLSGHHQAGSTPLLALISLHSQGCGWDTAEPYVLRHAVQHAVDADQIDQLLCDSEFLVYADPDSLLPVLSMAESVGAKIASAVYRASAARHHTAGHVTRRQLLMIDAARYGAHAMSSQLANPSLSPMPTWHPVWATGSDLVAQEPTEIGGFDGSSVDSAVLHGRHVLVGPARYDIAVWDLEEGRMLDPLRAFAVDEICDLTACALLDGRPIVVGRAPRHLRIWDLESRRHLGSLPTDAGADIKMSYIRIRSRDMLLTGGADGILTIWDIASLQVTDTLRGVGAIRSITSLRTPSGPVAVIARETGTDVWDLVGKNWLANLGDDDQTKGSSDSVRQVTHTELDGRQVVLTAGRAIRVWDVQSWIERSELTIPAAEATRVACMRLEGSVALVVRTVHGLTKVWNLSTGQQLGKALEHRPASDNSLAVSTTSGDSVLCAVVGGNPVAIIGADPYLIIWPLLETPDDLTPVAGHTAAVFTLANIRLDTGIAAVVSGGSDGRIHVRDLTAGTRLLAEPGEEANTVYSMATNVILGKPILLASSLAGTARLWDLTTCLPLCPPLVGHRAEVLSVAFAKIGGGDIAITGGLSVIRLWSLPDGRSLWKPLQGHVGAINALACSDIGGRNMLISGGIDRTVRIWDLQDGTQSGLPLYGHTRPVLTVACTHLNGRPIAASGDGEGAYPSMGPSHSRRSQNTLDCPRWSRQRDHLLHNGRPALPHLRWR